MSPAYALLALLTGLSPDAHAYSGRELKKAQDYEAHVPANLRALVSKARYLDVSRRLGTLPGDPLTLATVTAVAASPCSGSIEGLVNSYNADPRVQAALNAMAAGMSPLPEPFGANPWAGAQDGQALLNQMTAYFTDWCTFLPEISGDQDNGLEFIQGFAWAYYNNPAGQAFVQGRDPADPARPLDAGLVFTQSFSRERGAFMDSPASTVFVEQWLTDPRIEIADYQLQQVSDYKSWNAFFTREITVDEETKTIPSRPATMPIDQYPDRDYIVVSPTDCIMNPLVQVLQSPGVMQRKFVDNPLDTNTVLDVKGIPISVDHLLGTASAELKAAFVGGTGLSCVLMPNTYHHFHAPVNGTVVHSEVVASGTYGYPDFPNWVPADGNVGRPGTDFSQFQAFQRGVVIIKVTYAGVDGEPLEGYVASIPVGLDTIGSVVLDDDVAPGFEVTRGYTRLGGFLYGGSLDILLFSKGLASAAVQTRLGNQINVLNIGEAP